MKELVFLLEELSAKEMLTGILPKLNHRLGDPVFIVFEGKSDLEKRMERKIRGYLNPDAVFIIIRDQDAGDCHFIKEQLLMKCKNTGKDGKCLVRIVCHMLENWFLADLSAVESAFGLRGLARKQNSAKFRAPDNLPNAHQVLTQLVPGYQKVSGARAIAPYMDIENKRSKSFAAFVSGYRKLWEEKPDE